MKEIKKQGTEKVRRKKVKRRARARITQQKGAIHRFVSTHSMLVCDAGSDQTANIEMITKFLVDHNTDKLFLVSDQYLLNLRHGLKQYYFRQSALHKSFFLPLVLFFSSFLFSKSAAGRVSLKSYALLFIILLYCVTKKVDSFNAFKLREFTEQYFEYRSRWAHFQVLIKAGYLVKLSSHIYKLSSASYSLQIELTEQLNYFYEEQIESINTAFSSIK